ncbi:hypothetical protein F5B21DRAFT_494524, partial [Xylaria acuta]
MHWLRVDLSTPLTEVHTHSTEYYTVFAFLFFLSQYPYEKNRLLVIIICTIIHIFGSSDSGLVSSYVIERWFYGGV